MATAETGRGAHSSSISGRNVTDDVICRIKAPISWFMSLRDFSGGGLHEARWDTSLGLLMCTNTIFTAQTHVKQTKIRYECRFEKFTALHVRRRQRIYGAHLSP
jgi:hypothetical protein